MYAEGLQQKEQRDSRFVQYGKSLDFGFSLENTAFKVGNLGSRRKLQSLFLADAHQCVSDYMSAMQQPA